MASVAWHGVEGENENRFIIYLNFWYVDFPLAVTKKKIKKIIFPDYGYRLFSGAELSRIINVINIS